MFWKKKNVKEHLLTIISPEEKAKCDKWMKEIGVSSMYSQHEAAEDPLLVKDAPLLSIKSKMESITHAHRQVENIKNRHKLLI